MKTIPNILRTCGPALGCVAVPGSGLRFLVLSNMGNDLPTTPTPTPAGGDAGLGRLTARELEACALHLADGWPQATVADWLGLSRRGVQLLLASASDKVPALRPLRARAGTPSRRPRVLHLSQIGPADRGPFDADDL